jgi:hypothetical protein
VRGPDEMIRAIKRRGGEDARTEMHLQIGKRRMIAVRKSDRETNS